MPIVGSFAGASARAYGAGAGGVLIGDFESIATITAGSAVPNIEFTSIPSTYTHLQIRGIARGTRADTSANTQMRFNSDTGTNYASHYLGGAGYVGFSGNETSSTYIYTGSLISANSTTGCFEGSVIDILDYANTNKFKTVRTLSGWDANGSGQAILWSGHWRSTSAITSITLLPNVNNFAQYSSFALYGVKA